MATVDSIVSRKRILNQIFPLYHIKLRAHKTTVIPIKKMIFLIS